jgi:hypothetical protein
MLVSKVKPQPAPVATVVSVALTNASAAANDETTTTVPNDLRNPLWIIAIGMAWFFAIVAAVMALS